MTWSFFYPKTTGYRSMTRQDLPAVHRILMAVGMDPRSSWSRTTVQDLETALNDPGAGGFVAVTDEGAGMAVGCVCYRPGGGQTLILHKLATLPLVHGYGLGQALVQKVERHAREAGLTRVLLAVSQFNREVIPFYERLGYVQTDEPYAYANPASPPPVVMVKGVGPTAHRVPPPAYEPKDTP